MDAEQRRQRYWGLPKALWGLPIGCMFLGILTQNLDTTLEVTTYNKIGSRFDKQQQAEWLTLSYQIAVVVCQQLYASLSDKTGRRTILLASYFFFSIGQGLWARGTEFWHFVIARLVVGIGAAAMWFMVTIILSDNLKRPVRPLWSVFERLASLSGQWIGAKLGAIVTEKNLKAPFLESSLPLALLCLAGTMWGLRKQPLVVSANKRSGRALSSDFLVGLVAFASAVVCICLGLGFVGDDTPGNTAWIWSFLCVGVVTGVCFVYHQLHTSGACLIDFVLVADSRRCPLFAATFFREAATMGLIFLIPKYSTGTLDPSSSSSWLISFHATGIVAGSFVMYAYIKWRKGLWLAFVVSESLTVASSLLMFYRWSGDMNMWEGCSYVLLFGIGGGASSAAFLVGLLEVTEKPDQATMYGAYKLITSVAVLASIAIANAVVPTILIRHIYSRLANVLDPGSVEKLTKACVKNQDCARSYSQDVQQAVYESFRMAYADVMLLVFGLALTALIAISFIDEIIVTDTSHRTEQDSASLSSEDVGEDWG